ncbi:uncharacterized protein LOC128882617 [Hylaeus volcanicus]|uniref:uncharacterized protein LOC128882617 n=1 Tax=Hylaeus volcanicus TaxID=313075 RepID=UPI0023B872DE|nr:uncharacterized protein LOC128882617 [Hylaeus volcanicus]
MNTLNGLEALNLILPIGFDHLAPGFHKISNNLFLSTNEDVENPCKNLSHADKSIPMNAFKPTGNDMKNDFHSPLTDKSNNLKGYNILYELRRKTAEFREGYINWRQFKPKGARGEASDVFHDVEEKQIEPSFIQHIASTSNDGTNDINVNHVAVKNTLTSQEPPLTSPYERDSPFLSPSASSPIFGDALKKEMISMKTPRTEKQTSLIDLSEERTEDDKDKWLRFYYNPFTPAKEQGQLSVNSRNLKYFKERQNNSVQIPEYNRDVSSINRWILHIGVGQFHRAHQLVYMDELLMQHDLKKEESSHSLREKWGYCGVGLTCYDKKMKISLESQDFLFTVLERSNKKIAARIIGSMFDYFLGYEDPFKAFKYLTSADLRIVSLTITEKGYCQDVSGNLASNNPFIQHDLLLLKSKNLTNFQCPKTAIGFIVWGLRERRLRNMEPFTVLSCDNLPDNGHVAKKMVLSFATLLDKDLATWIDTCASFPATMVDRITPIVADNHREILEKDFGILDEWPVVTEVFHQWVIENTFPQGRPPWENVGVVLVEDVRPFELMKLRLLNGGHSVLAYLSYSMGYRFVDDAISDLHICSFLRMYMDEVTSTIPSLVIDLDHYKETIIERFGNRLIKDAISRICEDGSSKFFNTLRDALMQLIQDQRHILWSCLGVASFVVFLATAPYEHIKDANKTTLVTLSRKALTEPLNFEHTRDVVKCIFGEELGTNVSFLHQVVFSLIALKYKSAQDILKHGGVFPSLFANHLASETKLTNLVKYALDDGT